MKFCVLSNGKLVYLNHLNSACRTFQNDPEKLKLLKYTGEPLEIETIHRVSNILNRRTVFNDKLVAAYYEHKGEWFTSKRINKYPVIYYNTYFKTKIKLDSTYTFHQNMINYLSKIHFQF
jgi:hypothetical protein